MGYFTGLRLHRPTKTDDLPANVLSHATTRRLIGADGWGRSRAQDGRNVQAEGLSGYSEWERVQKEEVARTPL